MISSDTIIQQLEQQYAASLVSVTLDFLLDRPLQDIISVPFVAGQISLALNSAVEGGKSEQWITAQVERLREQIPAGTPSAYIPDEILEPFRRLLLQEMDLQETLLRELLDHQAVEQLFQDILTEVLTGFTETLKGITVSATKSTPSQLSKGFGRLKAFGDRALKETSLGGLTQLLETHAQRKTKEYIDKSIVKVLDLTAERLSAAENRKIQGEYRQYVLDVFLRTDNKLLWQQIEVVETEIIVSTISQTIEAIIKQESFQDNLQLIIETALQETGGKSLRDLLSEAGVDYDWRSETEEQLCGLVLQFVREESFMSWLNSLLLAGNQEE